MFFIGGGKRGLPWGTLRTHRDIASAKSEQSILDFCSRLHGTEYAPISQPLLQFLTVTRDRSKAFRHIEDYNFLYKLFADLITNQGIAFDRKWDWLNLPSNSNPNPLLPVATASLPLPPHHHRHIMNYDGINVNVSNLGMPLIHSVPTVKS